MTWQWLFAHSFGVALTPYHALGLGLTVWLIYVADRLLDGLGLDLRRPHTYRHALYTRHCSTFALLWLIGLALDGTLVVTGLLTAALNHLELNLGLAILAAVILYGVGIHLAKSNKAVFTKELQIGVVFALGVTLPVWAQAQSGKVLVGTLLLVALCNLNCLLIAAWERRADAAQGQASLALALPGVERGLEPALLSLSVLSLATSFWLPPNLAVALGSSAYFLWVLKRCRELPEEILRALVDAALLTPLVYLLFLGLTS